MKVFKRHLAPRPRLDCGEVVYLAFEGPTECDRGVTLLWGTSVTRGVCSLYGANS